MVDGHINAMVMRTCMAADVIMVISQHVTRGLLVWQASRELTRKSSVLISWQQTGVLCLQRQDVKLSCLFALQVMVLA